MEKSNINKMNSRNDIKELDFKLQKKNNFS